jgi:hypothetical protein
MPADAAPDPEASFSTISCSSDGNCAAVGVYTPNGGTEDANSMAVAETNGTWGRAIQPAPPANGQAGSVALNDVACAPGDVCTAVGHYQDTTSDGQAMVVSETNGVWGAATEIATPANGDTFPEAWLSAISCGAAGSCAAVGTYQAYSNSLSIYGFAPLAVSETDGHWGVAVGLTIPSAPNMYYGQLTAVSCPPTGACVATGQTGSADVVQDFATSGTGAGWSNGTVLTGPSGAGADTMDLQSLSCPAAGDCSAVGWDQTSSPGVNPGTGDEVVDSETGGSWTTASTLTLPSVDTGAASAALSEVSCWTPGNCRALGGVTSGDTAAPNTFVTQTNGVWGAATAYSAALANSLSCPPSGACVAVGIYGDATTQIGVAGAFDYANGTWSAPVNVTSPADAAQNNGELEWVSCAPDGSCGAVGDYTNAAGDQLAMGTSDIADSSTTTVACSPSGSNDVCTATVVGNTTSGAPTGTVSLSTTAGTFPAGTTCSLVSTGPATSTCEVTFTTPGANSTNNPTITAVYAGDGAYASSSGKTTLCGDGADLELSSVTTVGRHDFGIEIDKDAVLNGCGLVAGLTVRWGNDGAEETLSPSDIANGGASAQVVVPWAATSGEVSISDGTTTSSVADNAIDSWRNTLGLSFPNYADLNDPENFVEAFPGSRIAESVFDDLDTGEPIIMLEDGPLAFYLQHSYDEDHKVRQVGRCAGFAWVTAAMADGSLAFDRYGTADTPYGLTKTGELISEIDTAWWKQFALVSQTNQISARADSAATLKDQLLADFGSNGYFHPALVSFQWGIAKTVDGQRQVHVEGHEVTAFAVRDTPTAADPGEYTIYAYDSNVPFDPSEDTDGTLHSDSQTASDIIVHSNGAWSAPTESAIGQLQPGARYLYAEPIASLEGSIQLGVGNGVVAESLADGTNIDQASDPLTGKPVSLGLGDSGDLTLSADDDQDSSSSTTTGDAALTGVDQITGPAGDWRDTLTNPAGAVSAFWRSSSTWASLTGTSGTDVATFSKAGSLGVSGVPGQHASSHATIQVFVNSAGIRTERVLTVTGALAEADVSAQIKGNTAIVHAADAGAVEVKLSYDGSGTAASYDLGSVHLGKGQTLTATPGSWAGLEATNAKLNAAVGGKRLRTTNHLRAAAASVASGSLKKRELELRLRVPSSLRSGAVNLVVSVRHAGHKVARVTGAITGHVGSRVIVKLRLPRIPPRRSTATITVTSLTDGVAPTSAVRVKHLKL